MEYDTELSTDELDRMIETVSPEWAVREAAPVDFGHHVVYRLTISRPGAERECYLKATPAGKDPTVDLEARILALLAEHTRIPVPEVYGVVDAHPALPAPYVLLEAVPGHVRFRKELATVSDELLRRIAHQTGRYLAELHALDAVDAFGFLTRNDPDLCGGQPSGGLDTIRVMNPVEDWKERCRESIHGDLNRLSDTQFADVISDVESAVEERIDDLEGPFEPVLARIDQSLEQVALKHGEISGVFDWEFTIAATPADDIVYVTRSLAGGPYRYAPEMPDRLDLVLSGVLEGYEAHGNRRVAAQVRANRGCYELIATVRSMVHMEEWYELFDLGDSIEPAARELRGELTSLL